jgi:hypothetical protein
MKPTFISIRLRMLMEIKSNFIQRGLPDSSQFNKRLLWNTRQRGVPTFSRRIKISPQIAHNLQKISGPQQTFMCLQQQRPRFLQRTHNQINNPQSPPQPSKNSKPRTPFPTHQLLNVVFLCVIHKIADHSHL